MKTLKITNVLTPVLISLFYILRCLPLFSFFPRPPEVVGSIGTLFWYNSLNQPFKFFIIALSIITLLISILSVTSFFLNLFLRIKYKKTGKIILIYILLEIPIILFLFFKLLNLLK